MAYNSIVNIVSSGTSNSHIWFSANINLTTNFVGPPTCLAPVFTPGIDTVTSLSNSAFQGVVAIKAIQETCYPPGFLLLGTQLSDWSTTVPQSPETYIDPTTTVTNIDRVYTPGTCPEAYSTVAVNIAFGTTFATCCPQNGDANTLSIPRGYGNIPLCLATGFVGNATPVTIINGTDTSTQSVQGVMVPAILVGLQSSDLSLWAQPLATPTPSSSLIVSSASATARLPITTSGPSSTSTAIAVMSTQHGLSSGVKAGIGTGISVAALLIMITLILGWRRRRNRHQEAERIYNDKPELPGEGIIVQPLPREELDKDNGVHELNGAGRPAQMDHMSVRAELEGPWRGWEAPTQRL